VCIARHSPSPYDSHVLLHWQLKSPYPFQKRDACLLYFRAEQPDGSILAAWRSVTHHSVPPSPGVVRVRTHGGFVFR
jgi:hypothetical protein